jgi:hypothetical protein
MHSTETSAGVLAFKGWNLSRGRGVGADCHGHPVVDAADLVVMIGYKPQERAGSPSGSDVSPHLVHECERRTVDRADRERLQRLWQ